MPSWPDDEPWENPDIDPLDLSLRVLPPDAFDGHYHDAPDVPPADKGPGSPTIADLLAGSCCGWPDKPTPAEAYEAFRDPQPSERRRAIIAAVIREGKARDWANAWYEGAFTWRQLAGHLRRSEPWPAAAVRRINRFRTR